MSLIVPLDSMSSVHSRQCEFGREHFHIHRFIYALSLYNDRECSTNISIGCNVHNFLWLLLCYPVIKVVIITKVVVFRDAHYISLPFPFSSLLSNYVGERWILHFCYRTHTFSDVGYEIFSLTSIYIKILCLIEMAGWNGLCFGLRFSCIRFLSILALNKKCWNCYCCCCLLMSLSAWCYLVFVCCYFECLCRIYSFTHPLEFVQPVSTHNLSYYYVRATSSTKCVFVSMSNCRTKIFWFASSDFK